MAELTLDKRIVREALEKMMNPAHRRAAVRWAQDTFRVSQRRECRMLHVSRRLVWYQSRLHDDAPLRRRLHKLAATRAADGSRRVLIVVLRRDGLRVNYKKVHRLYVEEGLQLKPWC